MKSRSILALALVVASAAAVPTAFQDHPISDEPELNTGSQFEQRACPHVREVNGVKRCIGNKERRDPEPIQIGGGLTLDAEDKVSPKLDSTNGKSWKRGINEYRYSKKRSDHGLSESTELVTGSNPNENRSDGKPMEEVSKRACPHVRDVDGVKRCIGNKERRETNVEGEMTEDILKRACPHGRDVDGVKRCIGSKQKRDEETFKEDESFRVGLDEYSSGKQRLDDCPTCEGKLKDRDIVQQDDFSERNFDRLKRPKVAWFSGEERDDCPSCDGSKSWGSGSGVIVTGPQSNAEDNQDSSQEKKTRAAFVTDPERLERTSVADECVSCPRASDDKEKRSAEPEPAPKAEEDYFDSVPFGEAKRSPDAHPAPEPDVDNYARNAAPEPHPQPEADASADPGCDTCIKHRSLSTHFTDLRRWMLGFTPQKRGEAHGIKRYTSQPNQDFDIDEIDLNKRDPITLVKSSRRDAEGKAASMAVSLGLCVGVTALWIGKEVVGWGFTILLGIFVVVENMLLVFDS